MGLSEARLPAIVSSTVIAFALGMGAGMAVSAFRAPPEKPAATGDQASAAPNSGSPGGMAGMGGPGGMGGMMGKGAPGGMGGGMGGGMMRGPSPKIQLVSLVNKLDQLSAKPLAVTLDDAQKKKVQEQIKGLDGIEQLSDDEAKKRLDSLLDTVKGQKDALVAAGYRWPGDQAGGFRPPADVPNPFKEADNAKHLKSLGENLAKPEVKK